MQIGHKLCEADVGNIRVGQQASFRVMLSQPHFPRRSETGASESDHAAECGYLRCGGVCGESGSGANARHDGLCKTLLLPSAKTYRPCPMPRCASVPAMPDCGRTRRVRLLRVLVMPRVMGAARAIPCQWHSVCTGEWTAQSGSYFRRHYGQQIDRSTGRRTQGWRCRSLSKIANHPPRQTVVPE